MRLLKLDMDLIEREVRKIFNKPSLTSVTINFNDLAKVAKKEQRKVEVKFSDTAIKKIKALVAECSKELAWHMTVTRTLNEETNAFDYHITDVLVYPQRVTGVTVESDDDLYPQWIDSLPDETINQLRGQGHSHVNMGTSPSGTDTTYYNDMLEQFNDFYIFLIVNKSNSVWMQLIDYDSNTVYDTADIIHNFNGITRSSLWAKAELTKYLVEKKIATTSTLAGSRLSVGYERDSYYDTHDEYGRVRRDF